jgi:hypothetical protein
MNLLVLAILSVASATIIENALHMYPDGKLQPTEMQFYSPSGMLELVPIRLRTPLLAKFPAASCGDPDCLTNIGLHDDIPYSAGGCLTIGNTTSCVNTTFRTPMRERVLTVGIDYDANWCYLVPQFDPTSLAGGMYEFSGAQHAVSGDYFKTDPELPSAFSAYNSNGFDPHVLTDTSDPIEFNAMSGHLVYRTYATDWSDADSDGGDGHHHGRVWLEEVDCLMVEGRSAEEYPKAYLGYSVKRPLSAFTAGRLREPWPTRKFALWYIAKNPWIHFWNPATDHYRCNSALVPEYCLNKRLDFLLLVIYYDSPTQFGLIQLDDQVPPYPTAAPAMFSNNASERRAPRALHPLTLAQAGPLPAYTRAGLLATFPALKL